MSKKNTDDGHTNTSPAQTEPPPAPKKNAKVLGVFTYVGGGEDSPRVVDFMGKQRFVRGKAAEVTDADVFSKIVGNPTFIEGEVSEEELHDYDQGAKKEADDQRKRDKTIQKAAVKASSKHDWADKEKGSE